MKLYTIDDLLEKDEAYQNKLAIVEGEIIILDPERLSYCIELSRCNSYPKIVEWVHHLSVKNWVKGSHIRRFIDLACKLNSLTIYGHDE